MWLAMALEACQCMRTVCVAGNLRCNWLRGHAKPSVFCHPYTLGIFRKDAETLVVISGKPISKILVGTLRHDTRTSGYPKASGLGVHNADIL